MTMLDVDDELLTAAETAALLKVTPHTVYRWIARGKLASVRYSRKVLRIRRSDLDQLQPSYGPLPGVAVKGSKEAVLRFAGILTEDQADELWRVIEEDRLASLNDAH